MGVQDITATMRNQKTAEQQIDELLAEMNITCPQEVVEFTMTESETALAQFLLRV